MAKKNNSSKSLFYNDNKNRRRTKEFLNNVETFIGQSKDMFIKNYNEDADFLTYTVLDNENMPISAMLAFHEDGGVEIFAAKVVDVSQLGNYINILAKANDLNMQYKGKTFYLESGSVAVKSYILPKLKIERIFNDLILTVSIAIKEFSLLK